MAVIEERRATYAGVSTRELAVRGTGPTIVLIHGFAHPADTWRPVLDLLNEAGQAAVAVDLPGFGAADPLSAGELVPQLDVFVAAVIRHYGATENVVVVGNSLGAAMTARAGRNKDLPIAATMPLGIAGITWTRFVSRGLVPVVAAGGFLSHVRFPNRAHRAFVMRALSRGLYGQRHAVDLEVVALLADAFPDVDTTHRLLRLGARFKTELDRKRELGGVVVPMIVVHGARDPLVPVSASRILHEANPGSRLVVLKNVGHCPQLDAADVVARCACELAGASTNKEIS